MRRFNPQAMWAFAILFWMVPLLFIAGCQNANPVKAAETTEQRAYASYGTFVIFQEKAADLVEQPGLSNGVKLRIINAEAAAKPVADNLLDAYTEFLVIKAQFDAGETTQDKLVIASNNLDGWVTQLAPLVNELIRNLKGAEE